MVPARHLGLGFCGAFGGGHGIAGRLGRLVFVGEEELAPGFAQVPLDVVGEHAQKEVGPDAIGQAVMNRADLEIHRLQGAEGAFDPGRDWLCPQSAVNRR